MSKTKEIATINNSALRLSIYVFGYHPQGESILIILWDEIEGKDAFIRHSILIDYFGDTKHKRVDAELNKLGLNTKKIDFVIWSHPDTDHCKDLSSLLTNYTNSSSKIILPDGLLNCEMPNGAAKDVMNKLHKLSRKYNNVTQLSASEYSIPNLINEIYSDGKTDSIPFSLDIINPVGNVEFRRTQTYKTVNPNNISLVCSMAINGIKFYFGGDVMNEQILCVTDLDYYKDVYWVKIPHHGSNTSDKLLSCLVVPEEETPHYAISTCFRIGKSNDPQLDVLDQYRVLGYDTYCTDSLTDNRINKYGIFYQCIDVQKREFMIPILEGAASKS